jgi:hypothetical protein
MLQTNFGTRTLLCGSLLCRKLLQVFFNTDPGVRLTCAMNLVAIRLPTLSTALSTLVALDTTACSFDSSSCQGDQVGLKKCAKMCPFCAKSITQLFCGKSLFQNFGILLK